MNGSWKEPLLASVRSLDAEIDRLTAARKSLLAVIEMGEKGVSPGKSKRPAERSGKPAASPVSKASAEYRIAQLMYPQDQEFRVGEVSQALNIPNQTVSGVLNRNARGWFQKSFRRAGSPWRLTQKGRDSVRELQNPSEPGGTPAQATG